MRTTAAGILGHMIVNMPSLRLAFTSESYNDNKETSSQSRCYMMMKRCGWRIENEDWNGSLTLRPSGTRTARRKVPKRSSCIGIVSLGA